MDLLEQIYDFTKILIIFSVLYSGYFLLKHFKPEPFSISFGLYLIITILIFTVFDYKFLSVHVSNNNDTKRKVFEAGNCLFTLLELQLFYFFFKTQPYIEVVRKGLKLIYVCYSFIVLLFITTLTFVDLTARVTTSISISLAIFELLILFLSCIIFYYSTVIRSINSTPVEKNSLFITNCLFLYASLSLPFFIISERIRGSNLPVYYVMFFSHFLLLIALILSIGRKFRKNKYKHDRVFDWDHISNSTDGKFHSLSGFKPSEKTNGIS